MLYQEVRVALRRYLSESLVQALEGVVRLACEKQERDFPVVAHSPTDYDKAVAMPATIYIVIGKVGEVWHALAPGANEEGYKLTYSSGTFFTQKADAERFKYEVLRFRMDPKFPPLEAVDIVRRVARYDRKEGSNT